MKPDILDNVCMLLLRKSFVVRVLPRKWFDIVARRDGTILIVKVLSDANSISQELSQEMLRIGTVIGASVLIIAEKAGEPISDGIVYFRFGINTITLKTLSDSIDDKLPLIMRNQSGLAVSIDGQKLSDEMENRGFSLSDLSRRVGVSRQMIVKYKNEQSEVSVKKAEVMHGIFGEGIFRKVNIFSVQSTLRSDKPSDIAKKYEELGFNAADVRKAPFDIIANDSKKIILTEVNKTNKEVDSITKLIDASSIMIYDKQKPKDKSIASMSKDEFMDISTARELIKFLNEFE